MIADFPAETTEARIQGKYICNVLKENGLLTQNYLPREIIFAKGEVPFKKQKWEKIYLKQM